MPSSIESIAVQALKLSAEEREALIERLIASIEPAESLHPDWAAEVVRRVADMQAGRARFIPADEAMVRLAAHIHSRRSAA
jgi:putative addiction module component (TIGR02574 family)